MSGSLITHFALRFSIGLCLENLKYLSDATVVGYSLLIIHHSLFMFYATT
jgi:hypothetical protein